MGGGPWRLTPGAAHRGLRGVPPRQLGDRRSIINEGDAPPGAALADSSWLGPGEAGRAAGGPRSFHSGSGRLSLHAIPARRLGTEDKDMDDPRKETQGSGTTVLGGSSICQVLSP